MSKWGVPQFGSFNVDLVGKAWKTVETSIDKAIGIPQSPQGPSSQQDHTQTDHIQIDQRDHIQIDQRRDHIQIDQRDHIQTDQRDNAPSTTTSLTQQERRDLVPAASITYTPRSSATTTIPPKDKVNNSSSSAPSALLSNTEDLPGESIALEELLNGSSPIPSPAKVGPKIVPKSPKLPKDDSNSTNQDKITPETSKPKEAVEEGEITRGTSGQDVDPGAVPPASPNISFGKDQAPCAQQDDNNNNDDDDAGEDAQNHQHLLDGESFKTKNIYHGDENPHVVHDVLSTVHDAPAPPAEQEDAKQEQDDNTGSVTRSSSSSSLMELGSDASELELKSRLIELNGKMAAIAIIEKEKDRQLEEKTKQLAIREKQLESSMERQAKLSSELQNLTEEVEKLRTKPSGSSSSSSSSTNDLVESLKEEFSRRLGATEKKLQAVTKERDDLKKGQSMGDQAKGVVKAKDDEINTLRTEGTNLSHKILQLESTLKKYRASKKEDDASLAALREKLTQAEALLEKRNDRVKQLEFSEKKYLETITTMKDVSDVATRKLKEKEQELSQAQKQLQELQLHLSRATLELQGAKRDSQDATHKSASEVEDAKRNVAQEYQGQVNKLTAEFQARLNHSDATIAELRTALSAATEQGGKKEDNLNKEISHLRASLDAAEKRNEEIMQSIPDSTRPLLRQIEALQSLLENKSRTADALERDLRARLADEEARCNTALEKDRISSSMLSEITHKATLLETQYEEEHNMVSKLRTEVETLKLEEKKYKRMATELTAKLSAIELQEEQLNLDLRQGEERHQRTISAMRELEEALTKSRDKEKEAREELNKLHRFGPPGSSSPFNMRSSSSQDLSSLNQASPGGVMGSSNGIGTHSSSASGSGSGSGSGGLSGSMAMSMSMAMAMGPSAHSAHSGSIPLVERLQAMLSHRDGEIAVLQSQLTSMEAARKELQEELTAVTSKNEMLTHTDADLHVAQATLQDLQAKFSTALQLVGEKEEQVMELKMDIQDLKEMYRTQISELVEQNERLRKK